ncbi:MAG TPA: dimethylarginine dimethylaminohydrolase [Galbitalea sp.]|jgi:dimethylargininase
MTSRASFSRRLFASLVAGLGTALIVFGLVLAIYSTQLNTALTLAGVAQAFAPGSFFVLLFVAGGALLGGLTTFARSVIVAAVTVVVAPYLGTVAYVLLQGRDFGYASQLAVSTYGAYSLVFIAITAIVILTVSRPLYNWAFGLNVVATPEVHRMVLVRPPVELLAKGEVTYVKRKVVKVDKARQQWEQYVATLENEGFEVVEVEPADEFPDSVFIEDTVVMLDQVAVITSPGAESRRGEQDAVDQLVPDLGLESRHIRLPGTLDGGDVLKVGKTIYVGRGGRTNAEGIRQFRAIAGELGYTVVAVPVTKALHLKSSVTALPDGTVIGHPSLVDDPAIFDRYLEVPEAAGVAVVVLSKSAVLMASSAPKTAALITDLGYRVVTVDIAEFEKLEGCVTCLSVRIR